MTAGLLERPVEVLGSTTPRLFTPPLVTGPPGPCGCGCALTPETSAGFRAAQFATEIVGVGLFPWQRWWLIHALEIRPDGTFRFKTVLTLVARQNGKTHLLKVLALYFLYLHVAGPGKSTLVLGAAQALDIAREAWQGAVELAQDVDDLADEIAPNGVRIANGSICLTLDSGARYRIAAATRGAGRGLSVDLLILDELREHRDWGPWGALSKTTSARANSLIVGISNAGDDQSVVLNAFRAAALAGTDDTLGLIEYSAPDGCQLDDVAAIAQANPSLNYPNGVPLTAILSALATDPPAVYRTETLCQKVDALDSAVDPDGWNGGADPDGTLAPVRERIALCLDAAPDGQHVTLTGAAVLDDGRVRVETFGAWPTVEAARHALPTIVARVRPAAFGWFPTGPGAALGTDLRGVANARELKGSEVAEVCQGFAALALARRILHPNDPLLNAQIAGAGKLPTGDGWRFSRKGATHVDAVYASAGAVHIARSLPPPVARLRARIR